MKDTLSFLVQSLLQKNKIKVDREELNFQIQSHPSYPSLHAITGVLNHFNIDHLALRVPIDANTLSQLPNSFIAQLKFDNTTDLALVIRKGNKYKAILNNKKSKILTTTDFLQEFTGILVGVEPDDTKPNNRLTTTNFIKPLLVTAILLFNILFFYSNPNLTETFYFLTTLTGVIISYLIIQHDLGLDSKIIDKICSQESKTTNCNAVLNSKGATLYKNVKLSDISLIYFISISTASLLLSITNHSFKLLYIISLIASPVVFYSIYYQLKISKNWCVLCLGIVSVLITQTLFFFYTTHNFSSLSFDQILIISFSFVIITSFWLFTSSKLKLEQDYKKLKIESNKFKRNFDLFNTILSQSPIINTILPNTPEIILGNKNAPLNITVITNPFCGHCKSVHTLVESLLKTYHNNLNITIRFNINTSNTESNGVLVSSRLLELFHNEGELECLKAMHDIYTNPDAKSWLTTWNTSDNSEIYKDILEAEYNWCLDNNINFTPEILVNGQSYPKVYDRSDLTYFIEDLNETCSANTQKAQLQKSI